MNRLDKRINYLYNLRKKKIFSVLKNYNMNEIEYGIIGIIYVNDSLTLKELSDKLKYDEDIVRILVNELIDKNCIHAENDILTLSVSAIEMLKSIKKDIRKIDDHFSDKISYDDYQRIVDSLDMLIDYYED